MMKVRNSTLEDIEEISKIYAHAREQMIINHNPHQWRDSEPKLETVIQDIKNGNHYIIENNSEICGVFSMIPGKDPTYEHIVGNWINDLPYVTIHRIASNNRYKGIFDTAINYSFTKSKTVRIDTHMDNSIMLHLINKYGFTYCGIIYLPNSEPRLAFMKTIN